MAHSETMDNKTTREHEVDRPLGSTTLLVVV